MRQYTWDEYYEKFYDWSECTQVRNLYGLTSLDAADADEVAEIIMQLGTKSSAGKRLFRKAVEAKLAFSSSDLVDLGYIDDELIAAAVRNSAERLSAEDVEYLYDYSIIDDKVAVEICKQRKLVLPKDLREEEEYEDSEEMDDYAYQPMRRPGFFGTLFGAITSTSTKSDSKQRRHSGRCNGDCAHCPPHYGYRYGRWYYGHCHVHGCEFGGNRGDGSMD